MPTIVRTCTDLVSSNAVLADLLDASSIISLEAAVYPVGRCFNVAQPLSVYLFGLCAQPCNRNDLLILLYALLKFTIENTKTCVELAW